MPGTNEQKVVNISGTQNDNLVNFYTPEEYLFENVDIVDQGGLWNRNIVSVRVENVEDWQIEDMDHYFRRLRRRNKKQFSAKFSIIFSPIYNVLRWLGNLSNMAERGNCAYFTSSVCSSFFCSYFVHICMSGFNRRLFYELSNAMGTYRERKQHIINKIPSLSL